MGGYARLVCSAIVWFAAAASAIAFAQVTPQSVYEKHCADCHASGKQGAPKLDDKPAWQVRMKNGYGPVFESTLRGKGAMPPKGGNASLTEDEVLAAATYMLGTAGVIPFVPSEIYGKTSSQGVAAAAVPAAVTKAPTPAAATATAPAVDAAKGKSIYQATCAACHAGGIAGAPKTGDAAAWAPRIKAGNTVLYASALRGKGAMPAKGGNAALAETDLKAAVDFMVAQARGGGAPAAVAATTVAQAKDAPKETAAAASAPAASGGSGKSTYQSACAACHGSGLAGAPKFGDAAQWAPRIKAGADALYASALKGKGAMPAKGGNASLAEADVKAAVDYMVTQAGGAAKSPGNVATTGSPTPAKTDAPAATVAVVAAATTATPPPTTASPAPRTQTVMAAGQGDVNAFNRLLRAPGKRNLPPMEDGIHDAQNDGTSSLQPPLQAFDALPKAIGGNQIDWVKSLQDRLIAPRADRVDQKAEMAVLDLNIVREVKGSMPDVVYPHKQHTEWLDCSNCHPAIFVPQKGANQISMAAILLGQKCGVCHGKVAFPVSDCKRCHSKPKATAAGGKP